MGAAGIALEKHLPSRISNDGDVLRLAFLGCGGATAMHSRTLRAFRGEVRCSYASRDRARALEFNRRFAGGCAFGSYEAALASPSVDAVLVATPTALHLELALAALEAGKDVIVEKPAWMRASEADIVGDAARRSGRMVMVAENYDYKPMTRALRRLIASGELGTIRRVEVNARKRQAAHGWRAEGEMSGGGALFEGGIHWISFIAGLGMEIDSVRGFRPAGGELGELERSMLVAVRYAGGAVGVLDYSWEARGVLAGVNRSRIVGDRGSVVFESNGTIGIVRARVVRPWIPGLRDLMGYRAMFGDFLRAVRHRAQPEYTLAYARRDLAIVERAYATAAEPGAAAAFDHAIAR